MFTDTSKETYIVLRVTPNNFFIAVHNRAGNILNWVSKGRPQYKYHKRVTTYAVQTMMISVLTYLRANDCHVKRLSYRGKLRIVSVLKALNKWKIYVWEVVNRSHIPHNGCRGLKPRRL